MIWSWLANGTIGLTQLGTRYSDGSCQAGEDLIAGFSAIEAEAELVQVRLKLRAATVIRAKQKRFQVADGFVKPMQVARFILFRVQFHARQVPRSEERRVGKECRSRWSDSDYPQRTS